MRLSWALSGLGGVKGIVEEARLCEVAGLDGVWYFDYEAPFSGTPELFAVLSQLAASTEKCLVGSLVTDVLRRHPMVVAHAFATLNHLAPGRVVLGLGAGGGLSHVPYGIGTSHLASKLEEGIEVSRALWRASPEEPAYFEGKYFRLERAGCPLRPASRIPVYVASFGPRMLEITARLADGWVPESHTPQTYRSTLEKLREKMEELGREPRELEPCLASIFYPFEPDDSAYERLSAAAKRYLATYPDILLEAGTGSWHPGFRTHRVVVDEELWSDLASRVPDALADATMAYGELDECLDRIAKFAEAGCEHLILEPYWIETRRIAEAVELAGRLARELRTP